VVGKQGFPVGDGAGLDLLHVVGDDGVEGVHGLRHESPQREQGPAQGGGLPPNS
jgi:hypothetical protein